MLNVRATAPMRRHRARREADIVDVAVGAAITTNELESPAKLGSGDTASGTNLELAETNLDGEIYVLNLTI
jgi:hypothetical protein